MDLDVVSASAYQRVDEWQVDLDGLDQSLIDTDKDSINVGGTVMVIPAETRTRLGIRANFIDRDPISLKRILDQGLERSADTPPHILYEMYQYGLYSTCPAPKIRLKTPSTLIDDRVVALTVRGVVFETFHTSILRIGRPLQATLDEDPSVFRYLLNLLRFGELCIVNQDLITLMDRYQVQYDRCEQQSLALQHSNFVSPLGSPGYAVAKYSEGVIVATLPTGHLEELIICFDNVTKEVPVVDYVDIAGTRITELQWKVAAALDPSYIDIFRSQQIRLLCQASSCQTKRLAGQASSCQTERLAGQASSCQTERLAEQSSQDAPILREVHRSYFALALFQTGTVPSGSVRLKLSGAAPFQTTFIYHLGTVSTRRFTTHKVMANLKPLVINYPVINQLTLVTTDAQCRPLPNLLQVEVYNSAESCVFKGDALTLNKYLPYRTTGAALPVGVYRLILPMVAASVRIISHSGLVHVIEQQ